MPSGWKLVKASLAIIVVALVVYFILPIFIPEADEGLRAIATFLKWVGIIGLIVGGGKIAVEKLG